MRKVDQYTFYEILDDKVIAAMREDTSLKYSSIYDELLRWMYGEYQIVERQPAFQTEDDFLRRFSVKPTRKLKDAGFSYDVEDDPVKLYIYDADHKLLLDSTLDEFAHQVLKALGVRQA